MFAPRTVASGNTFRTSKDKIVFVYKKKDANIIKKMKQFSDLKEMSQEARFFVIFRVLKN